MEVDALGLDSVPFPSSLAAAAVAAAAAAAIHPGPSTPYALTTAIRWLAAAILARVVVVNKPTVLVARIRQWGSLGPALRGRLHP